MDWPVLFSLIFLTACNNLNFDGIRERYRENMSGTLNIPANLNPSGTNAFTFSVMGDTHIGVTPTTKIAQVLTSCQTFGDSFILAAGDLTNLGKENEYNAVLGTFNSSGLSVRVAIGNHDLYFDGWNNYKKYFGRSIYSFDADNLHVVVLDSGNGTLGEAQVKWLESDLSNSSQPLKIVISHFPPISGGFDTLFKMSSEEEAAIFKNIMNKYNVNYMISGHYHGYREQKLGSTTYIVTGGVNTILDPGNSNHFIRFTVAGNSISVQKIEL